MRTGNGRWMASRVAAVALLGVACASTGAPPGEPPTTTQSLFKLRLTGMLAFAPTEDDGLEVLLLNQYDGEPAVQHFPQLEVDCELFPEGSDDRGDCAYWPPVVGEEGERAISLSKGFEIRLHVGGAAQSGKVTRLGDFDTLVIPLVSLDEGVASRSTLRREATLLPFPPDDPDAIAPLIAKVRLQGGQISARRGQAGKWQFVPLTQPEDIGDDATWEIPYDPAQGVRVELVPPGASTPDRTLLLRSPDEGQLLLTLSNEPDAFEFCQHLAEEPGEQVGHFVEFYELTAFGRNSPDELTTLPLPTPIDAQCTFDKAEDGTIKGRKVVCMMVRYGGRE